MTSPGSPDSRASEDVPGLGQTIRDFAIGQILFKRYKLKGILGRGGMGIVWRAFDEQLEREVALKFLPELLVHDRSVVQDLKRETRQSLELTHPHIVRIYDFVQDDQSACISMELIDGDTLSNLRADKPTNSFGVSELQEWIRQLCDALQYAHCGARIVHRDLKPANLMVNKKGDLKVADFGISRSMADSFSMLTMGRGTSGTLPYMSPQQLDGERPSPLDDIYSLGATVYELLASKPPFYSGGIESQIRNKIPPSIAQRRAALEIEGENIPPNWQETIAACLAKDPAQRPQSAAETAWRLGLSKNYEPPAPLTSKTKTVSPVDVRVPGGKSGRNVGLITAVIFLLAGLIGFGSWLAIKSTKSTESESASELTAIRSTPQASVAAGDTRNQIENSTSLTVGEPVTTPIQQETAVTSIPSPSVEQPAIVIQSPSPPPIRSTPNQTTSSASLSMNRELTGSYNQNGRAIPFSFKAIQETGSTHFHGVITEPYTSFGVAKKNRLWADVQGEITESGSVVKVRFTKTYRYFKQLPVSYQGKWDPSTGEINGRWTFPDQSATGDTFRMR
jgi:serine/threonine protein kinase